MDEHRQKRALRPGFIKLLKSQKEQDRLAKSARISQEFFKLDRVQDAKTILFYASFGGEVETFAMMRQAVQLHKRIALPIIVRDQRKMIPTLTDQIENLKQGSLGVLEPVLDAKQEIHPSGIDVVVVPGLAFDRANFRLGRGAGYYDRFLADLPKDCSTIGLAFDFQVVDTLPRQAHDIALDHLIIA